MKQWNTAFLASTALSGALLLAAAVGAQQKPERKEVRFVEPAFVTAGQPATLKIYGQDLPASALRFDESRILVKSVRAGTFMPKDDAEKRRGNSLVEVEVEPAADLKPGRYPFLLTGEKEIEARGEVTVDVPAPETQEQEPNHDLRKPQELPAGSVTVLGTLNQEGADVFQFQGKAGETWRIELFSKRLNPAIEFEPVLRLRDPRRAPLRAAVSFYGDCFIEVKLPEDGPYLVELTDGDNRAQDAWKYRLALRKL
ncbi:MAG: hypothetical protein ACK47B_15625 [Armatimonadota bacterium]